MADALAPLRRRVAARQGVVTRRESALAELQAKRGRARSPARRRDLDGQIADARRALAADRRALAALRRELRELREGEPPPSVPPAPPSIPPAPPAPPAPPEPPSDPYEGRVLSEGGGVGVLPSGMIHGLVWVPEPRQVVELGQTDPDTGDTYTVEGEGADHRVESWVEQLERLLDRLAPHPRAWAGRLRIQLFYYDPELDSTGYGPGGDDGDAYEVGDAGSPPAGVGYFPSGGGSRSNSLRTLTGWTRTPGRLLEVLDLVGERLSDDWELDGVVLEVLWIPGAPGPLPGPLPKGEVTAP